MKAILYDRYGSPDVLRCEEVEQPIPGDDEVLIRVRAASVNPLDWRLMRGEPRLMRLAFGLRRPRRGRPGVDVAGVVEAAGGNVTRLRPGDEVFGNARGALAEYACARESALVAKPSTVTFEQAAAAPVAAFTALQGLRDKARLQAGQTVLIVGAAGGVGTFAVQIAKWLGAEVTGVCGTRNVELVLSLGADRVIDYTREDFTQGDERYDAIFDLIADRSLSATRRVLKPQGTYVMGGVHGGGFRPLLRPLAMLAVAPFVRQRLVPFLARQSQEDVATVRDLMAAGTVRAVVDRCYPLDEAAEALRYLEKGHAQGKVVVKVG